MNDASIQNRTEELQGDPAEVGQLSASVHYMRVVAQELCGNEKQVEKLLQGTGISLRRFIHDDFKFSLDQQAIFCRNLIDLIGDEDLGLRVGRRFTPETQGAVGFLACSSPNVKMALANLKRYFSLVFPIVNLELSQHDGKLSVTFANMLSMGDLRLDRAAIEMAVQLVCAVINSILPEELVDAELQLSYAQPGYVEHYRRYFAFPVSFSQPKNVLMIDQRIALTPNPIARQANYALALKQCDVMIEDVPTGGKLISERINRLLLSSPPGTVSEEAAAQVLFVSKRTLHRRLNAEGTSFRELRDRFLADIASRVLLNSDDSIESVALLLNYYDASNFTRAFKKWYGLTPEAYRLKYQGLPSCS